MSLYVPNLIEEIIIILLNIIINPAGDTITQNDTDMK